MSEEILIRQGAPTLAGIKTGSLFPFPCEDHEALMTDIRKLNRRLTPKGLCLLPLRFLPGQVLLYLYRPAGLRRDLRDVQASELLRQAGYGDESCERCVARLACRFRESKSPASADPWAAFGKAVGYRREVCGRTHPDNLHQPDSQQD